MSSPVVQLSGVVFLPHGSEQSPCGAVRLCFGLHRGEQEAYGAVSGGAHVTVLPVGHILHQPFNSHHGKVMHV